MKRSFYIPLAFLSLLIGVQALISCSDSETDSDIGIPLPPLSSCFAQNSSGGGGNNNSSGSSSNSVSNSSISSGSSSNSVSNSSISSSSGSGSGSNSSGSSSSSVSSSSEPLPLPTIDPPKSGYYPSGSGLSPFTIPAQTYCDTSGTAPRENGPIGPGTTLNFSSLTKNTVLQCATFKDGKATSKTILRTYIIDRMPSLPVVSIAVDPDKMFNSDKALYKSSHKPGSCGESGTFFTDEVVPIYVDFFEKGAANPAWSYPAGIKIHGGCSRKWPKKTVIVSFKEEYGQKNLNYPLFPDFPNLTKFKHFMLRNNGNNYDSDYIRDMLMSSLTEGLNIDYQKGRAVVVFYNGKYYGIHNLRERANGDYFETNYGINEDLIDLVKVEKANASAKEEVSKGSDADYQSIITWLNGVSLSSDDNYRTLEQRIDIDNFINHFQSRIFYKDCDWPGKNMKRWRSSLVSPKWRWLLYDTDHGFGSWGKEISGCGTMEYITATNGPDWPNPPHSTLIMRKLMDNQKYKYAFINRFSLLLATYFTTANMNAKRTELNNQISSETSYDQAKWGAKAENGRQSMSEFASNRPAEMQSNIKSFFGLGSPVDLTLTVNGSGRILVHNLPLPKSSVTFNAYSTVPITIKAEGSGFKGWSNGVTTAEQTVTITTATTITANF